MRTCRFVTLALVLIAQPASASPTPVQLDESYASVVSQVSSMVSDPAAQGLAQAHKLQILNVLWEDTGRFQGSSVGPNISDVTIEVELENQSGRLQTALMPVIRPPNFTDKTGDIKLERFFIRVGNQNEQGRMRTVPLKAFLKRPTRYMSFPQKGRIKGGSLLAPRDAHVLVSAQAAFLPISGSGQATFRPVIFNYQSTKNHPAVLTLLVTREGTSMSIVDNARDTVTGGRSWGQRLFFNAGGKRAALTAERLSVVKQRGTTASGESADSLGQDANLLMLIQVPLKVKRPRRTAVLGVGGMGPLASEGAPAPSAPAKSRVRRSNVEEAVLGHGRTEGPFTELAGLTIERDPRFPIRVTVQFYQATSNGVVDQGDMARLAAQIEKVYARADYVGSLVVPSGDKRPTTWDGAGPPPADLSWDDFPGLVERWQQQGPPPWWHGRAAGIY